MFCRTISVWYALVIICVCVECTSLFTDEINELLSPSAGYLYAALQIGYLLLMFFLTSLVASQIPEEAAKSVDQIHTLTAPYSANNIAIHLQVQLFVSQLTTSPTGLTGWKFFVINRGVVLTILGAIISYMVIVIQMNPVAMNALGG
ncbi:gustatory receptor for sugar taste 64e-like [Limulus polyphemus]|uniref:Gustatory receptor for sugar taste 64e-like n=1 Tax=Limulus polyphemus TaxID=6850 RepID=A0ABM1C224_LIMPO|nr:gustatory receptor for sugar taste 64e-like [Limulus polyphemus]